MFGLNREWAPVVSGLTGVLLTGLFGLTLFFLKNRTDKEAATKRELAVVYGELLARTFSFARRVDGVGALKQLRSGLSEDREVVLGRRKPLDLLMFHDWMDLDFRPLSDAWSRIYIAGSQDAIIAADELMEVSSDLMDAAIATDSQRRWLAKFVVGERKSTEQVHTHQEIARRFFEKREAFAVLARKELGADSVRLPLERSRHREPNSRQ